MPKLRAIALGTALAAGVLAFGVSTGTSQAAGVAAGGASVLPNLVKSDPLVETVRHRRRYRSDRYRHRYQGFWYAFPFWLYSTPAPSYRYSGNHVQWCLHRYRSYNPRTDMFLGYDGRYHRCRSPYRP
jgi:type IV secretory pathway TrbD component